MIFVLDLCTIVANLFVATFTPMVGLVIMIFLTFGYIGWSILNRKFPMSLILTYFMNNVPTCVAEATFTIGITPMFSFVGFTSVTLRVTRFRLN
jgi:hypothetical protein